MDRRQGVVARFHSNLVDIRDMATEQRYLCSLRGRFRLQNIRPIVGDVVEYSLQDDHHGRIENILPRNNLLTRPNIANLDHVLLVVTYRYPGFSPLILDKFLAQTEKEAVDTSLVINKVDLLTKTELESMRGLSKYYEQYYPVIETSAKTGLGILDVQRIMAGKISTMAGMSGVGKSTLLNAIRPGLKLRTNELSVALERGVHTTTYTELIQLGPRTFIADTPGFAQLELTDTKPQQIRFFFPELIETGQKCLFSDCLHLDETGCAVQEHVKAGIILNSRFESYQMMVEEARNFHMQKLKKERNRKSDKSQKIGGKP